MCSFPKPRGVISSCILYEYISMIFNHFYKGKQLLWLPVCFPEPSHPFKIRSTLTGKNLFPAEQVLFFMS